MKRELIDSQQVGRVHFGPLGFHPGWPKRLLFVGVVLSPLFALVLIDVRACPTPSVFGSPCPRGGIAKLPSTWFSKLLTVVALATFVLLIGVWLARFAGAFGGPVAVKTLSGWR